MNETRFPERGRLGVVHGVGGDEGQGGEAPLGQQGEGDLLVIGPAVVERDQQRMIGKAGATATAEQFVDADDVVVLLKEIQAAFEQVRFDGVLGIAVGEPAVRSGQHPMKHDDRQGTAVACTVVRPEGTRVIQTAFETALSRPF